MSDNTMFQRDSVIAITGDDFKQAALYFEQILPLHSALYVPDQIRFTFENDNIDFNKIIHEESARLYKKIHDKQYLKRSVSSNESLHNIHNNAAQLYHNQLVLAGLQAVPLYHKTPEYNASLKPGTQEAVELVLTRVPLIDANKLEWDHILDIRRDPDFRIKLRRFKLFINDNYQEKEAEYIRDSLLQKIDDYEEACKRHGLTLTLSTLTKILNSKSLLGSLGIAATAVLCGQPALAHIGLVTGAVIEIGKVSLHIAEKRLEFTSNMNMSEIAILMDTKNKVSRNTNK